MKAAEKKHICTYIKQLVQVHVAPILILGLWRG